MAVVRSLSSLEVLPTITPAEYLSRERNSSDKHEYIDGLVYMMAGAKENQVLIVHNVSRTLGNQLDDRPGKVYTSDMKVRLTPTTYVYPDVAVVCGDADFEDDEHDVLLNPALIIEVLSSSTEYYDRGLKFRRYQHLASLQEYVLIAQNAACVERFVRQPDGQYRRRHEYKHRTRLDWMHIGTGRRLQEGHFRLLVPLSLSLKMIYSL